MLILTRKPDEGITLQIHGETIHVVLLESHGSSDFRDPMRSGQVKIGIEASPHCIILRDELLLAKAANQAAAASDLPTPPSVPLHVAEGGM